MSMKLDVLPIGLYQENIYILHDNNHVLIVDPGRYYKEIMKCIDDKEIVDGILLTHGHDDHTQATDDLYDVYHCPIYLHENDLVLVDKNANHGYDAPIYSPINSYEPHMTVGNFKLDIYHTPGHTSGSVCIRYRNLLFSGDTLFMSSIGRTDLYSGNEEEMMNSLRFLITLPHDLKVLPGHGPSTTIGQEIRCNPFLR